MYAGSNWHEREAHEMFGINFENHPNLEKLYLPDGYEGNPMLKSFELISREVKPWPGDVDVEGMPEESEKNEDLMINALDPQNMNNFSEASVSVEIETEDMTLNIGPQHPSTHGVLRLVAKVDGEKVHDVKPVLGYMHRGYEKLAEVRTYPQITTLVNRIDWVAGFANEIPFIAATEKLMEIEVPERASTFV